MATAVQTQSATTVVPLSEVEVAYNEKVNSLSTSVRQIASDVRDDMKVRQLPEGLKGDKVYGPRSANRSVLNTFSSSVGKMADVIDKLKKGATKKSNEGLIGFSVPGFIKPEMAVALGLQEGTLLWPTGGKPMFSAALITNFFTNRVMAHGLIHQDNLAVFTSDDVMKRLFSPYVAISSKPGEPPIDLDRLTYTGIQKLIKHFVEKRSKEIPGPVLTPELVKTFLVLGDKFKQLKVLKTDVTNALATVARAQSDLVKAKASLDAGAISQEMFNSYGLAFQQTQKEKDRVYEIYKNAARSMGI